MKYFEDIFIYRQDLVNKILTESKNTARTGNTIYFSNLH